MRDHPVLAALAEAGMRMGLGRMRAFLARQGDPHLAAPVVHVGGTNGKGSVSHMVGAVLRAQGFRVGVHTSPHLQHVNERMLVDDEPISDAALDALILRLDAARRAWAAAELGPDERFPLTWFEFTTACAFQHFADEKVDVMVIEVGMGGRLDATNVVEPVVSAIVSVGLDHCAELGHDTASIAGEKAGIIKAGVPAVVGPVPTDALQVIRAVAADRGAPLSVWGLDYEASGAPGAFRYRGGGHDREGLRVGLLGDHQIVNAGVALRVLDLLPRALGVDEHAVHHGLLAARNPGRLEWLARDLLVDGAHNPDGATALARHLAAMTRDRPRVLVLGGGFDKDIRSVAAALAPHVDRVVTTHCDHPRARPAARVAEELAGLAIPVEVGGPIDAVLPAVRGRGELVVVAGSLYLVGAVRDRVGG